MAAKAETRKASAAAKRKRPKLAAVPGAGVAADDAKFDRLIYERVRLGIMSALAVREELTFTELKGLFAHPSVPRVFDWHAALADVSASRADSCEYPSGFKGIERVPAAGVVDIGLDRRSVDIRRYWMLPARDASPIRPPAIGSGRRPP